MNQSLWMRDFRWAIVIAAMVLAAMPMVSRAAAPSRDSDVVEYRIRKGETLISLAQAYFNRPADYRTVQRQNRIADPRRIPVGQVLTLPVDLLRKKPARLVIAGYSGPVEITTASGALPLSKGTQVPEGASVKTGANGFVSFSGYSGSTISIPSQSSVRIVRARRYLINNGLDVEVRILDGRGAFQPPKLDHADRYKVRTPVAVSAVRGTTFRVFFDQAHERAGTAVLEGNVELGGSDKTRIIEQGFGAIASDAGLAPSERLLEAPQVLDPGRVQTEESVSFALSSVPDARGYRTEIARDAGFLDVLAEDVTSRPSAEFADIPNGTLFVRSSAIAGSGIEGFSEVFSFRRQRLGVSAAAEQDPLDDGFKFAWEQQGEGDALFSFRLWQEGAEDRLLVAETGMVDRSLTLTKMPPGVYFWQVGATLVSDGEVVEAWGPAQKLTVSS